MLRYLLQVALIVVVFAVAWRKGGRPERYVASTYLAMLVLDSGPALIAGQLFEPQDGSLQISRFVLDLCALCAVVLVALRFDRWWTLWVGAVQMIAVMAHVLRAADMPLPPLVYAIMERSPFWVAILITGLGTAVHARRVNNGSTT